MGGSFQLLDLETQALAVQELLQGWSDDETIKWLESQGEVFTVPRRDDRFPQGYQFTSRVGLTCAFFVRNGEFVFVSDNTTYTARRSKPSV